MAISIKTTSRRRRRMMGPSLSTVLCFAAATCLPNAAFAMEENQMSATTHQEDTQQHQRQTQIKVNSTFTNEVPSRVSFSDNFGQTSTLAPNDEFNYRSCGSGITQAGFATLEFMYEIETNVSMSASTFLNLRQQQKQEEQLEFLESVTFPRTLSTALLERLQEKVCGYTFYQPVLEVISMSSGKDDEVWDSCNQTLVESRSCTRYVGSILIGVNNTSILGSVSTKVAKHVLPVIAADMFEGWYAQWMTDKLASTPVDVNGDPDYVGAVEVTRVNFVGVPIFGEAQTSASDVEGGGLTSSGYILLFLGLWLLFSICGFGYWVYRNMLEEDEEEEVLVQKTNFVDGETGNNNTFTMEEEEDEEDARKVLQLPAPPKARSNSYDDSYARQQQHLPYKYSDEAPPPSRAPPGSPLARMGILPIEVENTNQLQQAATPLQTPQATRSPLAHRRVQSAGNSDFYQFHPSSPGGRPSNDPRFISVTPRNHLPSGTRAFETPASPPRLSYQDYQPESSFQPYGASNSITESRAGGGGYSNYALDQTYHMTHQLPSTYGHNQELLNSSLPEWATPQQRSRSYYDGMDYHQSSRQPGTTTTVIDSRGRVRKEIAL